MIGTITATNTVVLVVFAVVVPWHKQCLGSESARIISRPFEQDDIDKINISEHAYRRASTIRMSKIERSFAVGANHHHFKNARWRRLWRQKIQDLLIAAIQNIKIILKNKQSSKSKDPFYKIAELKALTGFLALSKLTN